MKCPKCRKSLREVKINNVRIDRCKNCGGLWFDRNELKIVRDHRDKNLSWMHFDLWRDEEELAISGKSVKCPRDGKSLFKIKYGDSDVVVDVCLNCRGVWLDKNELNKIVLSLREKIDSETIPEYLGDLGGEVSELVKKAGVEIKHIMIIMKLIEYRIVAKHPKITEMISMLPD